MAEPGAGSLRAVVLVAGFATRLYPLTQERPKALLEVGGEAILTRLLRQIEAAGAMRDVVVVTNGKFHQELERWRRAAATELPLALLSDGVTDESEKLGAIADLELALRAHPAPPGLAGYLVCAGDNLFDFDLAPMVQRFLRSGCAQLLVRRVPEPVPPRRYNEVTLSEDGRVTSFREKPARPSSNLASIAVYLLPPELPGLVGEYLADGGNRDAPGYLLEWLAQRIPLEASFLTGRWFDIGDRADLERARAAFRR